MSHDNVFALKNPAVANEVRDALTEVLREGGPDVAGAGDREWLEFPGRACRLARCGRSDAPGANGEPEHTVQTGIGAVPVKAPGRGWAGRCASPRRSCRRLCGAPRRSRSCCHGCT